MSYELSDAQEDYIPDYSVTMLEEDAVDDSMDSRTLDDAGYTVNDEDMEEVECNAEGYAITEVPDDYSSDASYAAYTGDYASDPEEISDDETISGTSEEIAGGAEEDLLENPLTNLLQSERTTETSNWNDLFQTAVDMEEGPKKCKALSTLGRDFVYTSKTYGKIIISELSLPPEKKTVKPVDAGGIAGGMKYIAAGIFFKFAVDTKSNGSYLYGGDVPYDEGAIKGASNDMLGLLAFHNSNVEGLHFPLLCIIDYHGYRLLAMSILPIYKRSTLIYGSQDAGKHTMNLNKEFSEKMKIVAKQLNLKEHKIPGYKSLANIQEDPTIIKICTPVDIEGHLGTDGKYYVLDFGRTFPPEVPSAPSREIFYNLLRPELVRQYKTPLSSDAYSAFGNIDRKIHNEEVKEATLYLHRQIIPNFVENTLYPLENNIIDRITERIHRAGINCRHLGRIRSLINKSKYVNVQRCIMSEIVARTLKSILRLLQRTYTSQQKHDGTRQEPYKKIAFKVLKSVFSPFITPIQGPELTNKIKLHEDRLISDITLNDFSDNRIFWCITIKFIIQKLFKKTFTDDELINGSDVRELVGMKETISRLCTLSGIKLRDQLIEEYSNSDRLNFKLMKFDLKKLTVRVRHLNVIDEAEGNLLFLEAKIQKNPFAGIWNATHEKFGRAVASNTNNFNTFLQWGKVFYHQSFNLSIDCQKTISPSELSMKREEIFVKLKSAMEKFQCACEISSTSYECDLYMGLVDVEYGVINHVHSNMAEVSRIAESQWSINVSCNRFKEAFTKNPDCIRLLCSIASENAFQANESKNSFQAQLFLLRAFYIQYSALKASLVPPDTQYFFNAGCYLLEYLKRGGKDPGLHLAGASGSMIESALLQCPSISDENFIIQLDQSSRYLPELSNEQHNIIRPAYAYKIDHKQDPENNQQYDLINSWCHLVGKLEIRPRSTLLHFMPFTINRPDNQSSVCIGQLFHLLGQYQASETKHTFKLERQTFILINSACNKFLLTNVHVGLPSTSQSNNSLSITLVGSNFIPDIENDIEITSNNKQILEKSPLNPGHNEFKISQRSPCRYLIVIVESHEKVYSMQYLSFFGVQVDPTNIREQEKEASKDEVFFPRAVRWIKSANESITVVENMACIGQQRKGLLGSFRFSKGLKNKVCNIRASPAFTFRWDPQQKKEKALRSSRPVLLIIDASSDTLVHTEIIENVKKSYSSSFPQENRLKIRSFKSDHQIYKYLRSQDLSSTRNSEALNAGTFRIVCIVKNSQFEKEYVQSLLQNTKTPKNPYKNIPILFYFPNSKPSSSTIASLHSSDLLFTSMVRQEAIDFMSMKMESGTLNFDPHQEFGLRNSVLLLDRSSGSGISGSKSKLQKTRERTLRAHRNITMTKSLSSRVLTAPENAKLGPFLYFEVKFLADSSEDLFQVSVGLSPKRFSENEITGDFPGSFGFHSNGIIYCGDKSPYKFRDLIRTDYSSGDTIGCGYNQRQQEIYWTKNGRYLGVAERGLSQVPITSKSLFATVSTINFNGKVEANFGEQDFLFNPNHLEKIFEHSANISEHISLIKIYPYYDKYIFSNENVIHYLPILSNIAKFSSSLQMLFRAYADFSSEQIPSSPFKMIDLSSFHLPTPKGEIIPINDNVLVGLGEIIPRKAFALNLSKCNQLSEFFFEKVPNIERMHLLSLAKISSLSDKSAGSLASRCKLIRYLRVWDHISDIGLQEMPKFENLRTLDLTECKSITCKGFCGVIRRLTNLTALIIDECTSLTDECLNSIARWRPNLEKISMERTNFSEGAVLNFIANSNSLLSISIAGWGNRKLSPFSNRVVSAICDHMGDRIRGVNLYRSDISDDALVQLISQCKLIQELNIGNIPRLTDKAFAFLSRLSELTRLELMSCPITDDTLVSLVKSISFIEISLHRCYDLTVSGFIRALEYLKDCTFLCLKETLADDSVIPSIKKMPNLKLIDLRRTRLTLNGLDELKQIPNLIVYDSECIADLDGRLSLMWDVPNSRVCNIHKRKRSR